MTPADVREIAAYVAANRTDPAMAQVARETGAGYVVMHMQGSPATMQNDPRYDDVVGAVNEFFAERLARLHELYPPVEGEFDDYIARPKANGYQSLHTVLRIPAM